MKINKDGAMLLGGVILFGMLLAGAAATGVFKSTVPLTIPEGTSISIRLDHAIASDSSRSGDSFGATVAAPVNLNGKEVIPAGAPAKGAIVEARESGRLQTPARLVLALKEVQVDGSWYDVEAATKSFQGKSHDKRNWLSIGGGTAGGALIGGLAGGGKGAAIGAGVGAGAGTAAAAATGKQDIHLAAETLLSFSLADPLTVNVSVDRDTQDN